MAVIVITHDLGVVAEMADEIAVMYAGRIVERASAGTIFSAPEHPYTWGLLQSIPRLDRPREEPLVPIPGRPPSLIVLPSGCAFHPRCTYIQERHKRVVPPLDTVPDENGHLVACLLDPTTRRELWAQLRQGKAPEAARDSVTLKDSA
jgi:peptide/nickel transport system ATP-binding protein